MRLAIDDFGTGYSSLLYLKRMPVDALKVDRSFVDGLGEDPEDTAIVASVVGLAHAVGIGAVAEGVETQEQRRHLLALGCDRGQGYLWSRPVPAAEIPGAASPAGLIATPTRRARSDRSGGRRADPGLEPAAEALERVGGADAPPEQVLAVDRARPGATSASSATWRSLNGYGSDGASTTSGASAATSSRVVVG